MLSTFKNQFYPVHAQVHLFPSDIDREGMVLAYNVVDNRNSGINY